jgi:hypothetical protein
MQVAIKVSRDRAKALADSAKAQGIREENAREKTNYFGHWAGR